MYVREDAGQGEERFQRIEAVGQRALWALVTALSFLVAALVPAIQPNHRYPNQHPEEYEVMEEDGDDVKEENGCPIAVNMAQRGGPKVQAYSTRWESGFKSDTSIVKGCAHLEGFLYSLFVMENVAVDSRSRCEME